MRWSTLAMSCAAAAIVAVATWSAADAQTRRGTQYGGVARNEVSRADVRRARQTRARTRITVRRERSFLDPGPEIEPGSRSYTDYALPPGTYSAQGRYNPTREWRYPLPDPLYLPGCCLDY